MLINYIIGPAGSGKSTLTNSIISYVSNYNSEVTSVSINLDPGVQDLPYIPDIDIRDYITVDEVIEDTGLGPNGAIIEAADRMVEFLDEIKYEIDEYNNPEYVFVDTPGQMELFSFRNTGPLVANALGYGDAQKAIMFCYDAKLCTNPNGFISTILLSTSVQYRFARIPILNLLTKKDLLPIEKLDMLLSWAEDPLALEDAVERYERGMLRELTVALERAFREFGAVSNLIPVSGKYNDGIDEVFAAIQRLFDTYESPYL